VAAACTQIAALKPDLVVTEKGLSDLAAHFLTKVRLAAFIGCVPCVLQSCVYGITPPHQGGRPGCGRSINVHTCSVSVLNGLEGPAT
jgi:hypothetical protein